MARYRKALVALLGALVTVGAQLPADAPPWLVSLCAAAGALAVYLVPNAPAEPPAG